VPYRCPIDKFLTATNSAMCTHIMNIADTKHQEWIDSHGVSYKDLVLTGNYQPLKEVVERECRMD